MSINKDVMSLSRHVTPFSRYSDSPDAYKIRVILTDAYSVGNKFLVFSNVKLTWASCPGFRFFVPLKMTEFILSSRNSALFCSPKTQRIASTTFDLPEPFGPTMPITSSLKCNIVSLAKLLKPFISSVFNLIFC